VKIATEHAETEGFGTGEGMEEGLFFDRVKLKSAYITGGDAKDSALVVTDTANTGTAFRNDASVAAGETAKFAVGKLLVKLPLLCVTRQNLFEAQRFGHIIRLPTVSQLQV
jgi:hypothetical protein